MVTSDKSAPNQKLIKLHDNFYKARNLFAPERFLYSFSDAPHLVKAIHNNLASSGWGKNTRLLWVSKQNCFYSVNGVLKLFITPHG